MFARQYACSALLLCLAACSSENGDTTGTAPPPVVSVSSSTTTPLALTTEGPPTKPGIEPRVKAEVDGKPDGITGTTLAVSGARASLQTPTGWTSTKGDVTVVAAPDQKAWLAATSFAQGGLDAKLAAAVTAMGLTACEWNPPESLLIGKTTLAGNGADGRCTRGTAPVKTAYVAPTAEGLLVVGAWADGGDSTNVFGAMRSIIKVAGGGGSDPIAACCQALHQNAPSAPPDQQAPMKQAAAICDGLRNSPQGKAALVAIRGMLRAANMPSACK